MSKVNAYYIGSLKTGGAEAAVRNTINSLSQETKNRTILILLNDNNTRLYSEQLGVPVFNLNASGVLDASIKLASFARINKVNRIQAHLAQCIMSTGLTRLINGTSIYAYIHSFGSWKQKPSLKDSLRTSFEKLVINHICDAVIYVSNTVKKEHEIIGYTPKKTYVIPNPLIGEGKQSSTSCSTIIRIVTVGRIEYIKGLDWVVKAPWFTDYFSKNSWTIVGDGSYRKVLQDMLSEMPESNVEFLGMRPDVEDILSRHDVFLLPSRSEGLSVAIVEAMRAALPIVATDVGSNSELIRNGVNGYLVKVGDVSALKAALDGLTDSNHRRLLSENSRQMYKDKFDPDEIINKLESLLL